MEALHWDHDKQSRSIYLGNIHLGI
jgi:hypothetical protein